ncbi:MAG TPA: hypothetical protein PKD60_15040 [Turneriella sp.]|nr:hypothetical protein [Turneriella sp.]
MQRVLALGMINGLCLQTGDGDGVAIWYEPGRTAGFIDLMRAGLYKLPFRLGLGIYLKIQKILNQNGYYMKKIMASTPHYYPFHIGVSPAAQGAGFWQRAHQVYHRQGRPGAQGLLSRNRSPRQYSFL